MTLGVSGYHLRASKLITCFKNSSSMVLSTCYLTASYNILNKRSSNTSYY